MKFNSLQITSASAFDLDTAFTAPICVFCGRHADLVLDLMRELIGDYGAQNAPDRVDNGSFAIHADIEMDDKNYSACYIRNADSMGNARLAVNFEACGRSFSADATCEFFNKCSARDADDSNILVQTADAAPCDDDRPIFIYDCFDRLDDATDVCPLLDRLALLDRQVFISVCPNYPTPKMKHSNVQVIKI